MDIKRKVFVLYTGGTFGMKPDDEDIKTQRNVSRFTERAAVIFHLENLMGHFQPCQLTSRQSGRALYCCHLKLDLHELLDWFTQFDPTLRTSHFHPHFSGHGWSHRSLRTQPREDISEKLTRQTDRGAWDSEWS
ncbi:hypothetical protein AOLI_G00300250 [Acnodon oligacanthus]